MKTHSAPKPVVLPTEAEIREYAHHLYVASGWIHGRDLDNWLQAEAWLTAMAYERQARHELPPEENVDDESFHHEPAPLSHAAG